MQTGQTREISHQGDKASKTGQQGEFKMRQTIKKRLSLTKREENKNESIYLKNNHAQPMKAKKKFGCLFLSNQM